MATLRVQLNMSNVLLNQSWLSIGALQANVIDLRNTVQSILPLVAVRVALRRSSCCLCLLPLFSEFPGLVLSFLILALVTAARKTHADDTC